MDRRTPESSSLLTQSDALSKSSDQRSLPEEMLHSAVYCAVQAPLKGATQLLDKSLGTNILPSVEFMEAPQNAEFLSARWHAQQLGSAAGMVAPFLLLHKGVGKVGSMALGKVETEMATGALSKRMVVEAGATGFLYEGLLKPVSDQEGNFVAARTRNALVGGVTFATLAASAVGIKNLAQAETGVVGKVLRNDFAASALAGVPAGLVNAEMNSVLSGKGHASRAELAESAYSFVFAGGALSLGKSVLGSTKADAVLREQMKQESARAIADGAPTLAERAAMGVEAAQVRLNAVADTIAGPRLQPAFAGVAEASGRPVLPDTSMVFMSRPKNLKGALRGGIGGGSALIPADIVASMKRGGEAAGTGEGTGAKPAGTVEAPAGDVVVPEVKVAIEAKPVDVVEPTKPVEAKPVAEVSPPEVKPDAQALEHKPVAPTATEGAPPPVRTEPAVVRPDAVPTEAQPVKVEGQGQPKVQEVREPAPKADKPLVAKPTTLKGAVEKAHQSFDEATQSVRYASERQQLRQRVEAAEQKMQRLEQMEDPKGLEADALAKWQAEQLRQFQEAQTEYDRATDGLQRFDRGGWVNPERPMRSVAEAVRTAVDAMNLEPSSVKKRAFAKEAGVALEKLLGRIPEGYKGSNGGPDLPRFSDLKSDSPSKLDPVQRLNDLNRHLQGRVTELDAADQARRVDAVRQKEAAAAALLEQPVVKDLLQRAKDGKLHPHPEALVVFMDGNQAIQFAGPRGRQAGFSLAECADPAVLQARLAGHEVTGAVVFTPTKIRLNNGRFVPSIKASRMYGDTPRGMGLPTLRDFLDQHGERRN